MKNNRLTAFYFTIVFISLTGFGCSPAVNLKSTAYLPVYSASLNQEDQNNQDSIPEPEETLSEELADLEKIGEWQEEKILNIKKGVTLEERQLSTHDTEQILYDFPITYNKQVEFYLNLFQNKQRHYFERWLSRSTKYLPFIKKELKKAGLPLDLAYLAMIESGFNPSAYSKAHAAGLWQFIPSTGRHYDLRVDSWVDERREPVKATAAAIEYLSFLHKEFGDWHLAVAAYNAGEGKISRAIQKHNTRDFWKLAKYNYLKLETKRYVPKLIAAIIISKNPEKYGFVGINYQQPVRHDTISVPPLTSLVAIAMTCDSDLKTIQKLNNGLRKDITPPGSSSYPVTIPSGAYEQVARNLPLVHPVVATDYKTHIVKKGDSLTSICRTYNLNKTTLLKANDLHSAKLQAGKHLRIPCKTTKYVLLKKRVSPESYFAKAENGGQLILHSIRQGETLSKIAKLYQVSPEIIMQWNGLDNIHKIKAGQQLALYIDQKSNSSLTLQSDAAKTTADSDNMVIADNKKIKPDNLKNKVRTSLVKYYRVRNGDSLWNIAQKFKVSTLQIKKWNNLQSNTILPGNRLIIQES
jgi:membrane-bound lytic murein transglycosylase D